MSILLVQLKRQKLVYGGRSIKRNGIYDNVFGQLNEIGAEIFELAGAKTNSRLITAKKGNDVCKQENIESLIAVGGGSVIECTKLITAGVKSDGDPWDFVIKKTGPKDALRFGIQL